MSSKPGMIQQLWPTLTQGLCNQGFDEYAHMIDCKKKKEKKMTLSFHRTGSDILVKEIKTPNFILSFHR